MRILIASDKFAGTLSAAEATEAIAAGWRSTASEDVLELVPIADGGPGFLEVLHGVLNGNLLPLTVTGPLGEPVSATVLVADETAYIEVAQACGLHLVPVDRRNPTVTTSYGVGELLLAAIDAGVKRIVLGVGGSGINDAGAGMLAALGAQPADVLSRGGAGLADLSAVDLTLACDRFAAIRLVAASDVDSPLLGPHGTSAVFGPQKGATPEQVQALDAALAHFVRVVESAWPGAGRIAGVKGAGAAGGLGYALLLLGAEHALGIGTVADALGLDSRIAAADLVITGEGCFDASSLRGKVISGVAALAREHAKPCIVLAGQVQVAPHEMSTIGVQAAYSVAELAGSPQAAMEYPDKHLTALATQVAGTWSTH